MYMHITIHTYICIYMYIYREREITGPQVKDMNGDGIQARGPAALTLATNMYIYIYICIERERKREI